MSHQTEHNQRLNWRVRFLNWCEWRIGLQFGTLIVIVLGLFAEFIFGKIELANHVSKFHYDLVFWLIFFAFVWLNGILNPR
jgi:hypothetical protein